MVGSADGEWEEEEGGAYELRLVGLHAGQRAGRNRARRAAILGGVGRGHASVGARAAGAEHGNPARGAAVGRVRRRRDRPIGQQGDVGGLLRRAAQSAAPEMV